MAYFPLLDYEVIPVCKILRIDYNRGFKATSKHYTIMISNNVHNVSY